MADPLPRPADLALRAAVEGAWNATKPADAPWFCDLPKPQQEHMTAMLLMATEFTRVRLSYNQRRHNQCRFLGVMKELENQVRRAIEMEEQRD